MPPPRALIADDQPDVLTALRLLLEGEDFEVELRRSPGEVLRAVSEDEWDVALIDLNYARDTTSGREGLDLLSQIQALEPNLPVVVMTAWGSVEVAVEAMRRGARDFVEKPWDNARLLSILRNQVELRRALRRTRRLESENAALRSGVAPPLLAFSPEMRRVVDLIERVGPSDANVLITGEHGSGKEVVAHALHGASERGGRPLIAVNVGGLAEGLFESEMFGHVKGSFTGAEEDRLGRFELAHESALFLDEIANISMSQQARLLRVLETGIVERVGSNKGRRVDVRVLSATNADLAGEVEAGRFREDLLFRLNTVEVRIPPLRRRRDDILPLAELFLRRHAKRYRRDLRGFSDGAREALLGHAWPGNVRELDHAVQRAVLLAAEDEIRPADLGLRKEGAGAAPTLEEMSLEEVERYLIRRTLERTGGNVTDAANELGLSRSAMYRRLQKHGL